MAKLAIRIIVNGLGVGGTETHLSRVLPVLKAKYGWEIRVILFSSAQDLAPILREADISVYVPPCFFHWLPNGLRKALETGFTMAYLAWDFIKDRRSITHFFLPKSYLLGMLIAYLTRLPAPKYLSRRSLNRYQRAYPFVRQIETGLHRDMKAILVNSQEISHQLIKQEGVPPSKIITIYNGLAPLNPVYQDKLRYRRTLIEKAALPHGAWVFICVANLIPYKGHKTLLEALAGLTQADLQGRPYCLLCVGSDAGSGYAAKLRDIALSLGIADKVRWLGKHRDVFSLYAASDIAFLCSEDEGLSNALLEAMALSLPLVVTNVGGNKEVVEHAKTGWVVPVGDADAIRLAIKRLIQYPQERQALGQAGQQRVLAKFSLDECVLGYHRAYLSVMENPEVVSRVGLTLPSEEQDA